MVTKSSSAYGTIPIMPVLVNAGVLPQARNLILHLQLAALQLGDLEIIAGRMQLRFQKLLFQRLMPSFEFRKVRLHGHARFLLMSDGT
jgi:hypothetical protein